MRQIGVIRQGDYFKAPIEMQMDYKNPLGIRIMSDTPIPGANFGLSSNYGQQIVVGEGNVLGQLQSPSGLGNQIIVVAEYWLGQRIKEATGKNDGKFVEQILTEYGIPKGNPYCAVFCWFVVNEAAKTIGCEHNFPSGSAYWGSTVKTLEGAKKCYPVDFNPVAGSVMFRKSSGSYNHMGVTIFNAGGKFYTIEGNVVLAGGGEGIALIEYDYGEIKSFSMQFIHTEILPTSTSCKKCNILEAVTYNNYFPTKTVTNETIVKITTEETKDTEEKDKLVTSEATNEDKVKKEFGTTKETLTNIYKELKEINNETFDKQPTEVKNKICETIKISIPAKENIPHYSIMKNLQVVDDIFITNLSGKPKENVCGSAFGAFSATENYEQRTEFGIFQDKNGNEIYVLSSKNPKSQAVLDMLTNQGKDLKNILFIPLIYESPEACSRVFAGKERANCLYPTGQRNSVFKGEFYVHPDGTPSVQNVNYKNMGELWAIDVHNLLSYYEQKNKEYSKPIVFMYSYNAPISDAKYFLNGFIQLVNIVITIAPIKGLSDTTKSMLSSVLEILQDIANGKPIDFVSSIKVLGELAEFVAPEFVKGINKEYITPAKNAFLNLRTNYIGEAEQLLGINQIQIQSIYTKYVSNNIQQISQIVKDYGQSFNDVAKKLQNFSNMSLIEYASRWADNGNMLQELNKTFTISDTPILQDLFIIGASETFLPAMPNIQKLTKQIIGTKSVLEDLKTYGKSNYNLMKTSLMKNYFGYVADPNIYNGVVLDSLYKQAIGIDKFILPPSIPKDKQICYKYEIEQRTNKKTEVITTCNDGWEYDPNLRKCKKKSTIYVPDMPGTGGTIPTIPKVPATDPTVPGKPGVIIPKVDPKLPKVDPKIPTVTIPTIPTVDPKIPTVSVEILPCITQWNGKYYFNYNNASIEAKKENGNWFAWYNGYWVLILNCKLQITPKDPTVPTVVVPDPGIPKIVIPDPSIPKIDPKLPTPDTDKLKPCQDKVIELQTLIEKYKYELQTVTERFKQSETLTNQDKQKIYQFENEIKYLNERVKNCNTNDCTNYINEVNTLRNKLLEYEQLIIQLREQNKTADFDPTKDVLIRELQNKITEYQSDISGKSKTIIELEKQLKECDRKKIPDNDIPEPEIPIPDIPGNEPDIPQIPKTKRRIPQPEIPVPTNENCPDCLPAMELKKTIWRYPKCDEHCCNEFY